MVMIFSMTEALKFYKNGETAIDVYVYDADGVS